MKRITQPTLVAALAIAALASITAFAQNNSRPNRFLPSGTPLANETTNERAERPARPVPPIIAALDANQDGEIDATEIANATAALKTLDTNGDGKLSGDEIRPARPEGGRGPRR
jgi:hypothetical protein